METVRTFRVLRRRWKLIILLALVGLLLGSLAAVRTADDDGVDAVVEPVYYDVRHTLIVSDETDFGVNLEQAAFFTTIGAIPDNVAVELGGDADELAARVQTITDPSLRTLVISAVAETPDEATTLTNAFAETLLEFLRQEGLENYNAQLADAENAVTELSDAVGSLDDRIEALEERIRSVDDQIAGVDSDGDGEPEPPDDADPLIEQRDDLTAELGLLEIERNSTLAGLQVAVEARDALLEQGPPPAPLTSLDITDPDRVSQREFNQRIAAGREGQANYRAGVASIPAGGGGSSLSSSVLDNPIALIIGGLVGGLFIGLIGAIVWSRLDHRILDKEEAEQYFGLPVIAEIPKLRNREKKNPVVMSRDEPMSHIAEAYRSLRSSLIYARDFGDATGDAGATEASTSGTVVMVTSPGASEGKTSTVANLANVLAEEEYTVLAVNCDFRRPRLAFFLDGDHEPRRLSKTSIDGVRMINHVTAEGSEAHPTDVIRSQKRVIGQAKERFDVVLLDTAPLLATNDANEILPSADLVVIVAQVGRTTKEGAEATRELLERRRAPVAGVVLIGSDSANRSPGYYYYYSDRKGSRFRSRFWRTKTRSRRDARYYDQRRRDSAAARDQGVAEGRIHHDVADEDVEVQVGR